MDKGLKIAVAGKGGVGKTTLAAWIGDYLAKQGKRVWMVDADTTLSLGAALGVKEEDLPTALIDEKKLILSRTGSGGLISLTPEVNDLPGKLKYDMGNISLLVMGSLTGAGEGCACTANSILKALLSHLILELDEWVVVDLEAGVEHLGRGTISGVDVFIVVSEPSCRSLNASMKIASMARELGIKKILHILNRSCQELNEKDIKERYSIDESIIMIPDLISLRKRQLLHSSVLGLEEIDLVDSLMKQVIDGL
ncbi:MAG: AAA family ATPase [Desulfonatronovibrio sp.]